MSVITSRVCDVCKIEYSEGNPAWMILAAPNAPEDVVAEFDFCGYDCLQNWVNADDEDEPEAATPEVDPKAQARLDAAMKQVATNSGMSLADAIASGKLDFTRGPE